MQNAVQQVRTLDYLSEKKMKRLQISLIWDIYVVICMTDSSCGCSPTTSGVNANHAAHKAMSLLKSTFMSQ